MEWQKYLMDLKLHHFEHVKKQLNLYAKAIFHFLKLKLPSIKHQMYLLPHDIHCVYTLPLNIKVSFQLVKIDGLLVLKLVFFLHL